MNPQSQMHKREQCLWETGRARNKCRSPSLEKRQEPQGPGLCLLPLFEVPAHSRCSIVPYRDPEAKLPFLQHVLTVLLRGNGGGQAWSSWALLGTAPC